MDNWVCYIIENNGCTYVGASNNATKRLRAHNGEISGGAKYTRSKGCGWKHVCIIHGFPTKIESLQFEWALKHVRPKNAGGINNRIKKLIILLNKKQWTRKSPLAETVPLTVEWVNDLYKPDNIIVPSYIQVH
tara:strand:- start:1463 stop:1861 length:399 start_codon:yes stop_codon:yes gene_type:complete